MTTLKEIEDEVFTATNIPLSIKGRIKLLVLAVKQYGSSAWELWRDEYQAEDHRLGGTGRTFKEFVQQEYDVEIDVLELLEDQENA